MCDNLECGVLRQLDDELQICHAQSYISSSYIVADVIRGPLLSVVERLLSFFNILNQRAIGTFISICTTVNDRNARLFFD